MNHSLLETQMPDLVRHHVPRNARGFNYRVVDALPQPSMFGIAFDPKPFDGKVVALTDEAIIVKTARTQFAVINRDLATTVPGEGCKVSVRPYARRRFDGLRADTPEERTEISSDGTPHTVTSHILGTAPAKLPVPKPQCLELAQLIEQLENLPAPDGFRKITHLLVDANARDFSLVDPKPKDIIRTPPAIHFTVSTAKFAGQVSVLYDRGTDVYVVELHQNGELVVRRDEVYFDDLGAVLADLIDDGTWRQVVIDVLDGKSARISAKTAELRKAA